MVIDATASQDSANVGTVCQSSVEETALALPLFPGMTEQQVEHVAATVAMKGLNRDGGSEETPL